jgi:hypothetical protein
VTTADDVRRAMGLAGRSPALTVRCPHCTAPVGEECHGRTAKTRSKRRSPHPARLAAAPDAVVIAFPQRPSPAA